MNRYLELFRLENGIIGFIGIFVAAFIAAGTSIGDHWQNLAIMCVGVLAFIAGGNSLNDYIDRDIDKVAHPNRPLPSGRIQPKYALYIGIAALAAACICSLLLFDWLSTTIVIIACILMVAYETVLKQRGFVGNVTIALMTGMVFLLGGAIVGHIERCYEVAGMAFLVSVGREIVKDIEDMDGDKGDRWTLPMAVGKKKAGMIAAVFYVSGPVLSILPMIQNTFGQLYYLVVVADIMFIYAAYILFQDPHRSQKTAKAAMLAALVAFILGVI
jgi:geranylgeranylglycerol-phosphate geranylgeranyltransferase